jgi:RHS repeat-associated protein
LLNSERYGQGSTASVVSVMRDEAGRPLTVTSPRGVFTYTYTADGHIDTVGTPEGVSTRYSFDGPILTGTSVAGSVPGQVIYDHDTDLRLSTEMVNGSQVTLTYDADNLLLTAGDLSLVRDAASGFVEHSTLHKVDWTFGRNPYGEVDDRAATYAGNLFWATHVLSRDADGRILGRQESVGGEIHTFDYSYDVVGRLTDVVINGVPREHYEYDENGNRLFTTRPVGDAEAHYDVQDRISSHGGDTYTHTADGALASKVNTTTGATTLYTYDLASNLLEVSLPSGDVIEYVVDADGRRLARKVNGEITHRWVYGSAAGPAAEVDAAGQVLTRYVYGTRPWVPTYMTRGGHTYALVADALGSVRLVVDVDTGDIPQELVYDTFGVVVRDTHPGFQPFGFGGGLYDPATGLVRLGARDYDAQTGRWTTKDPLLFGGGDSNVYAYAGSDPVNRIDPAGLSVWSWLSDLALGASISADNILNGREDPLVDSIAGFGDTLSMGLTAKVRGWLGAGSFVNPSSGDYRRGSIGGVAYGGLMLVAGGLAAAAEGGGTSFFEGTSYTEKVVEQMSRGAGEFHSFPEAVTAFETSGTVRTITGGDGVVRQMLEIPGSYVSSNGTWYDGVFQFIKDADNMINHRLFVPTQ